jgi:nicotinate-nucleotide pyrophosphorylase (carboxylating)
MTSHNSISDPDRLKMLLAFLDEDAGSGDITTESLGITATCRATVVSKCHCVLAGISAVRPLLDHFGISVDPIKNDGDECAVGDVVLELKGDGATLLKLERLLLNIMARMSGIATATRKLVQEVQKVNPDCLVAATRKTTPGFRLFEKEAVVIGGGHPHRYDLAEAVMIKDNHLVFVPDPEDALKRAVEHVSSIQDGETTLKYGQGKPRQPQKWIEIEAHDLETATAAVSAGADIIMLDNMTPEQAEAAYKKLKAINSEVKVEISGGITPDNIGDYARFADIISLGYLTHSIKAADLSMKMIIE